MESALGAGCRHAGAGSITAEHCCNQSSSWWHYWTVIYWVVFQSSWSLGLGSLGAEKAEMPLVCYARLVPVSFSICHNRSPVCETSRRFVSSSMPNLHSPMPGCRPPSCRSWRRTRTRSSSPRHPQPPRPRWPARTRSCCSSPAQKYFVFNDEKYLMV